MLVTGEEESPGKEQSVMKTPKYFKGIFQSVVTSVLKGEHWISRYAFMFHILIKHQVRLFMMDKSFVF